MNIIEIEDAKDSLRDFANRLKADPLVIRDHGRPIAALLPFENTDVETVSLSTNSKSIALIEPSRRRQTAGGGISTKEMRKRLGLDA